MLSFVHMVGPVVNATSHACDQSTVETTLCIDAGRESVLVEVCHCFRGGRHIPDRPEEPQYWNDVKGGCTKGGRPKGDLEMFS